MAVIKATNDFVWIQRTEASEEAEGLWLPETGRVKPASGIILSAGKMVKDPDIKAGKGKTCLFHSTVGMTIPYNGKDYLVLRGDEIIGLVP